MSNYYDNTSHSPNPHQMIKEMKNYISENCELGEENKERFTNILNEADFMLYTKDEYYEKFSNVFESMAELEFGKRISTLKNEAEFIRFISLGLNMVVEELRDKVVHKDMVNTLFENISNEGTMLMFTDALGRIILVNNGTNGLEDFNENTLLGQYIHVIFKDYNRIDQKIKESGNVKDFPVIIPWKGGEHTAQLTVTISAKKGKIEGLVYLIKLFSDKRFGY